MHLCELHKISDSTWRGKLSKIVTKYLLGSYLQCQNVLLWIEMMPSLHQRTERWLGWWTGEKMHLPQNVDADSNKNDEDAGDCEHCKHPVVENTNLWQTKRITSTCPPLKIDGSHLDSSGCWYHWLGRIHWPDLTGDWSCWHWTHIETAYLQCSEVGNPGHRSTDHGSMWCEILTNNQVRTRLSETCSHLKQRDITLLMLLKAIPNHKVYNPSH